MVEPGFLHANELSLRIAKLGKDVRESHDIHLIEPFKGYFGGAGELLVDELDTMDGPINRREALSRYLLLHSVLDQGPDIKGMRLLLRFTLNDLYAHGIPILHKPISFFEKIDDFIELMDKNHEQVKKIRADDWANAQGSEASRYNLYYGQSMRGIVAIKQALQFAVSRWGTPLAVPLVLEKKGRSLVDYIESYESAEIMSRGLKNDEKLGLGKMIGNKACHLFAKSYVHSFGLKTPTTAKKGWSPYSFETPFDSNVGRVLFRTGWLQSWATIDDLMDWDVVQIDAGKGGTHYIRVTNILGCNINKDGLDQEFLDKYNEIIIEHLKIKSRWIKIEIQQIPNALLLGSGLGVGDFDDGLIHIGLEYCKNNSEPDCMNCPINSHCIGFISNKSWINDYRT